MSTDKLSAKKHKGLNPRWKVYEETNNKPTGIGFILFISKMKRDYLESIQCTEDRIFDHDEFTKYIKNQLFRNSKGM